MPQFEFTAAANQAPLSFEPFSIADRTFIKVHISFNGAVESCWVVTDEQTLKRTTENYTSAGYEGVGVLQNNLVSLYPTASWGLYVPLRFNGERRPSCELTHLTGDMIFCEERLQLDQKRIQEENEAKKKKSSAPKKKSSAPKKKSSAPKKK